MRLTHAALACVLVGAVPLAGKAQTVVWDVIGAGGEVGVASGGMRLAATVGQAAVGTQDGPAYRIWAGFWNPGLGGPVGGAMDPGLTLPTIFSLSQNHPNPFRGRTTIHCGLPRECYVSVRVYDLQGQLIRVVFDGVAPTGYHVIQWDGVDAGNREAASGVYVCRMTASGARGALCELQRPLLLIR